MLCDFSVRKLYNNNSFPYNFKFKGKSMVMEVFIYNCCYVISGQIKYIPVVHIILNRLKSIAAASFQSNIFLVDTILSLMLQMPLVMRCLNANQTTLPFSIKVSGDEGTRLDSHNNSRFLQGKRKSLDTTGYYLL